jgi:hypothetical protein
VVEVARRHLGEAGGEGEAVRMAELEGGREVELGGAGLDRFDDRVPVVAGVAAPQARDAVEHRPALRRVVVHVLGAGDEPRPLLEGAVRREGQPPGVEVVRRPHVVGGVEGVGAAHGGLSGGLNRLRTYQPRLYEQRRALARARREKTYPVIARAS